MNQKGFTLIETLVAILILSMTVGALLTLAAGGFYSVRYGRNQIIANNLLQESLEYVRNSRDTLFLQGGDWQAWLQTLSVDSQGQQVAIGGGGASTGCFGASGCYVDPYTATAPIKACSGACPAVSYYADQSFYGYNGTYPFSGNETVTTSYVRTITVKKSLLDPDQVVVTGVISWLDGQSTKRLMQSIVIANWKP